VIRKFIKYGFYLTLPLLVFTLLMKFRVIDQYLNTDYLFPIISVLFFLEIYCRGTIDKRK
jgi:hypothetical protein